MLNWSLPLISSSCINLKVTKLCVFLFFFINLFWTFESANKFNANHQTSIPGSYIDEEEVDRDRDRVRTDSRPSADSCWCLTSFSTTSLASREFWGDSVGVGVRRSSSGVPATPIIPVQETLNRNNYVIIDVRVKRNTHSNVSWSKL